MVELQSTEGGEEEDTEKPLPLLLSIKALQAGWQGAAGSTVTSRAGDMAQALKDALQPGKPNAYIPCHTMPATCPLVTESGKISGLNPCHTMSATCPHDTDSDASNGQLQPGKSNEHIPFHTMPATCPLDTESGESSKVIPCHTMPATRPLDAESHASNGQLQRCLSSWLVVPWRSPLTTHLSPCNK